MWQPLSHLTRKHFKQLFFGQLLFICIYALAGAWCCQGTSDLLFNFSCCCSVGKVGVEVAAPDDLSSFLTVLVLNLSLGTLVSLFVPCLPKAICLATPRLSRNHLCSFLLTCTSCLIYNTEIKHLPPVAIVWGTIMSNPWGKMTKLKVRVVTDLNEHQAASFWGKEFICRNII